MTAGSRSMRRCASSNRLARTALRFTATASSTGRQARQPAPPHAKATSSLADFGIAKATEQSSITQVGSVLGTAAYLAPEQARGEEAGPSADLYALASSPIS